eukprot:scaffold313979_cov19-Tisochrysis_lutea.AAC.1
MDLCDLRTKVAGKQHIKSMYATEFCDLYAPRRATSNSETLVPNFFFKKCHAPDLKFEQP